MRTYTQRGWSPRIEVSAALAAIISILIITGCSVLVSESDAADIYGSESEPLESFIREANDGVSSEFEAYVLVGGYVEVPGPQSHPQALSGNFYSFGLDRDYDSNVIKGNLSAPGDCTISVEGTSYLIHSVESPIPDLVFMSDPQDDGIVTYIGTVYHTVTIHHPTDGIFTVLVAHGDCIPEEYLPRSYDGREILWYIDNRFGDTINSTVQFFGDTYIWGGLTNHGADY